MCLVDSNRISRHYRQVRHADKSLMQPTFDVADGCRPCGFTMTLAATFLISCVTVPSRPALLDLPVGPALVALSSLVDVDPDPSVVDVRLEGRRPAVIAVGPAQALVLRIPAAPARTLVIDDASESSVTTSPQEESVWLLALQPSRAYAIRAKEQPARLDALVVVQDELRQERVLLLDDVADGIERKEGLGNVVTVNGQRRPTLAVARGAKERWHFANTAVARTFVLVLPGHVFAGVDGAVAEVVLAPGACASVDVELGNESAAAFDLVTLDGDLASGEAWPLIHVLTTAVREKS